MPRSRELAHRMQVLSDIRDIMAAMRGLALTETRRLSAYAGNQRRAAASIAAAMADFHRWFLAGTGPAVCGAEVVVAIGSERGFCGDFNERVRLACEQYTAGRELALVSVGARLGARWAGDPRLVATLGGADVAEACDATIDRIAGALEAFDRAHSVPPIAVTAICHEAESGQIVVRRLLPFELPPAVGPRHSHAPRLHVEPAALWRELTQHHLYVALYDVLYGSLIAENRRRLEHMESAIRRLDKDTGSLRLRANALRQEEITEEIEVILLSAEALKDER